MGKLRVKPYMGFFTNLILPYVYLAEEIDFAIFRGRKGMLITNVLAIFACLYLQNIFRVTICLLTEFACVRINAEIEEKCFLFPVS